MTSGVNAGNRDLEVFCGIPDEDGKECPYYERFHSVHYDYGTGRTTWECPECNNLHDEDINYMDGDS